MGKFKSRDRSRSPRHRKRSRGWHANERETKRRRKSREPHPHRHHRRSSRESTGSRSPGRSSSDSQPTSTKQAFIRILEKLADQDKRIASIEVRAHTTEPVTARSSAADQSLATDQVLASDQPLATDQQQLAADLTEGETILQNRGLEPGFFEDNCSVSFLEQPVTYQKETITNINTIDELFGPSDKPPTDSPWPTTLFNFVQSTVR